MFMEWWERVRGFDRWPETQARIASISWWGIPEGDNWDFVPRWLVLFRIVQLSYSANGGLNCTKTILFPALHFNPDTGDKLAIRYSPINPQRVYAPLRTKRVLHVIALLLIAIVAAAVVIH